MTDKIRPLDKAGNFWEQTVEYGCGYRVFNFQDKKLTDADGKRYSFAEVEDGIGGYEPALKDVRAARERFLAQRGPQERIAALEKELRQEAYRLAQSQKGNQRLSDENKRLAARIVECDIRVRRMQEYFNACVAKQEIIERLQKELAKQAQKTERLKRLIKQAIQEGDE
jgi:predicted RNase H-like nuclease (RuvC/YqgF family)